MTDRQVLAVHGLTMLAVIDIRIVQIDELFIAIGDAGAPETPVVMLPTQGLEGCSRRDRKS